MLFSISVGKISFLEEGKHPVAYLITTTIITIGVSFALALVAKKKEFNEWLLFKSPIHRSFSKNFWSDVIDDGAWYRVHIKESNYYYEGQIVMVEENEHCPFIVLGAYRVLKVDSYNVIKNYNPFIINNDLSSNETRSIIINTEEVDYIEVIKT